MRKFIVNVNGSSYEVEVEEMTSAPAAASKPAAAPAPEKKAEAPKAEKAPTVPLENAPAGGTRVSAPMPGTIKKIAVKNGDRVKKNDILFILEAMKLENEIYSPCDGVVASVDTAEGTMVNPGDSLCTIA